MKKRILSLLLIAVLLISSPLAIPVMAQDAAGNEDATGVQEPAEEPAAHNTDRATARPLSAGLEALRAQYKRGVGPEVNGKQLDYRYYSPVGKSDSHKYPLVVFFHGREQGAYEGRQIQANDFCVWTSAQMQARFRDGEGAFMLALRSPEEDLNYWGESTVAPAKAAIDDFIATFADNVDTRRIIILGWSIGARAAVKLLAAYPNRFSAGVLIGPYYDPTASEVRQIADIPLWIIAAKKDTYALYTTVRSIVRRIGTASSIADVSRFSTISGDVMTPTGSDTDNSNHKLFHIAAYDMFTLEGDDMYGMETTTFSGKPVTLTAPYGIIDWVSAMYSDYDGADSVKTCDCNCHSTGIRKFFWNIGVFFWRLFNIKDKRYCECGAKHW